MDTNIQTDPDKVTVSFSDQQIFLGIDVHKKNWNISVYIGDTFFQNFHQEANSLLLLNYLNSHFPEGHYVACYEAGFCGFSVQRELKSLGIDCIVVNPADIPQTNKGMLSKTDTSDSRRLGTALSRGLLNPIYIPDKITESDRQLIRYRRKTLTDLQKKRKILKSAFHSMGIVIPKEHDKPYWTKRFIEWIRNLNPAEISSRILISHVVDDVEFLRRRLLQINKDVRQLSSHERYKEAYSILISAPGIGIITAMTLLTEIGEIKRFDNFGKFNSFIGLCPSEFSSGETIRKGKMTSRANTALRPLLIEAAWIAIRTDPALALKFQELIKTRTKKRAIVVIARKLLSRIYHIWTNTRLYEKGILK
ncbi:IS110 family RNA-guided transposase [Sphingobacterium faecale]|uniref:IS110 family transposase n=1 Tax=Sphingobacterium faecale TaxID=2803775 RepID=A0ABS1R0H4_9SPHI|nr:IS110 family transposase [Sphingobacterium faecale]MBL1407542.1 IS110 family transposase [Sphingobacterium faecale]